jgi:hypothetical protein
VTHPTLLVAMGSIVPQGAGPQADRGYVCQLSGYWCVAGCNVVSRLRFAWPLFVFLLLFTVGSATITWAVEHGDPKSAVHSWPDAFYFTWITMATVGHADASDSAGRVLTALDVSIGVIWYALIGGLISSSLPRPETASIAPRRIPVKSADGDVVDPAVKVQPQERVSLQDGSQSPDHGPS